MKKKYAHYFTIIGILPLILVSCSTSKVSDLHQNAPYGSLSDKKGIVYSPDGHVLNVYGIPGGTTVKHPVSGEVFKLPEEIRKNKNASNDGLKILAGLGAAAFASHSGMDPNQAASFGASVTNDLTGGGISNMQSTSDLLKTSSLPNLENSPSFKSGPIKSNLIDQYGLSKYRGNSEDHVSHYINQADTWYKTYKSAIDRYGARSKYATEIEKAYNNHKTAADLAKKFHHRTKR